MRMVCGSLDRMEMGTNWVNLVKNGSRCPWSKCYIGRNIRLKFPS